MFWVCFSTALPHTVLAPGKKAAVPIYTVFVRPGREPRLDRPAPKRMHLPIDHGLVY